MRIKKIKPEHITNCQYCKAEGKKVRAVWHLTFENKQACDVHRPVLQAIVDAQREEQKHYTEADYQTWLRL